MTFNIRKDASGITASDILVHLELPLSLLQYMCSRTSLPSRKPGTLGSKPRQGLAELKRSHDDVVPNKKYSFLLQ